MLYIYVSNIQIGGATSQNFVPELNLNRMSKLIYFFFLGGGGGEGGGGGVEGRDKKKHKYETFYPGLIYWFYIGTALPVSPA